MITFQKGMNQDVDRKLQPEGSYHFAMNAVMEDSDGDIGGLSNERGTELVGSAPYPIIGHVNTDTDDVILFSTDEINSEIGSFNTLTNEYTTILNTQCLNFSAKYPIFALYRIVQGCERNIYFTDRNNKYRSINLDRLNLYQLDDGTYDCDRMHLSPNYQVPNLDIISVNDFGGQLKVGAYQVAVRYLDASDNPSNWFYISTPVMITDEALSDEYYNIDGAIPIFDNADPEPGAVPLTTKSFTVELSNLDQDQAFYQLAIIQSSAINGTVSEVWTLDKRSIANDTESYTYGGASTSLGHFQGSLTDIIVPNEIIDVVQHHEQKDNSLILAGMKGKDYDYASFQRAANDIEVSYITEDIQYDDQTILGSSKNPRTSHVKMNMMRGEVYALGIQYLLRNSKWTNAFHIPGRESIPSDLFNVGEGPDTEHLGPGDHPAWLVHSTSSLDGDLGYYETQSDYPDTTDCNGDRVYPLGKIRHHKMPDARNLRVQSFENIKLLGLEFSNIMYPSDDIVGHRFVYGRRDDSNSTVIDTGLMLNIRFDTSTSEWTWKMNGITEDNLSSSTADTKVILSPKGLLDKKILGMSHISPAYNMRSTIVTPNRNFDSGFLSNITISARLQDFTTNTLNQDHYDSVFNRTSDGEVFVGPKSTQVAIQGFDYPLRNESLSTQHLFVHLVDPIAETDIPDLAKYVTIKRNIRPYENLDSIYYFPMHHNPKTLLDSQQIYGGDTYISELALEDIPFVNHSNGNVHVDYIRKMFVESTINFSMRYGGTSSADCSLKYNPTGGGSLFLQGFTDIGESTIYKVADFDSDNDKWELKSTTCPEFYEYNYDFSKPLNENIYQGLQRTFNYCSDCIDDYPYRIMYSEQSFQEDLSDNYRIFRSSNYRDLDGSTGPIEAVVEAKGQLYILTTGGPWVQPISPQQLQTSEATAYIGTGERFSIPPAKLATSTHKYGGTNYALSLCKTEYGVIYVDDLNGKVFLLSDKLNEISMNGMKKTLETDLFVYLRESEHGITSPYGTGVITTYDHRNRRVLIHNRDFAPLYRVSDGQEDDTLQWDGNVWRYWKFGASTSVSLDNPLYFENRSKTISYFFPGQAWVSYHSYLPRYFFHNNKGFYSVEDGDINKHGEGAFTTYYGTKYPYIIDGTENSNYNVSKVFQSVEAVTTTKDYTSTYPKTVDDTFTQGIFYTYNQSTGIKEFELIDPDNPFASVLGDEYNEIRRVDDEVQVSNLINLVSTDVPVFSYDWNDIQNDYFIDKVPINIDPDKSMFNMDRLRGEWLGVRFFFKPEEDYKITTNLITTNSKMSYK